MARWFLKGPGTPSGRWKLLAGSVLAAAVIGLSCGLCESSTKQVCQSILSAIASSLSPTDQSKIATKNNIKNVTTSRPTTHSITTTSGIFSKDSDGIYRKKLDIFIAENTGMKISDRITTRAYLTSLSTTRSLNNKEKELEYTLLQPCKNYGLMDFQPLANSTTKPPHTLLVIYSKKSQASKLPTLTYAMTKMGLPSGSNPLTLQCH